MESLSIVLSSSPISPNKNLKFPKIKTPNSHSINKSPKLTNNSFKSNLKSLKNHSLSFLFTGFQFQFPLSSYSSDQIPISDQSATKIDLEAMLVSIDDFFNRYPFFVGGVVFIWLFVIPVTEEYLRKYKFISAVDAFKKLKEDPNSQLLDIRDAKTLRILGSPNLKFLNNKTAVQVEFRDGDDEGGFVNRVKESFKDPGNTIICVLDNFDGESMKVAELLFNNGFKEAYAIKGGVRGSNGWLEIQETLLPPSVHIKLKRKVKKLTGAKNNGAIEVQQGEVKKLTEAKNNGAIEVEQSEVKKSTGAKNNGAIEQQSEVKSQPASVAEIKQTNTRSSSPYPMYPDLKPPSSPTPSKPQ